MIQEHIHKLLFEHDCVIIPDFGGLITHYQSARIHPVRHAILPPSKRVAFNEKLKLNDGLLISTFAYDKKITAEAAQQQVAAFVRQLQEELHASQRFELRGIGLFRLNAEQKIEFDYLASSNFLNDSFGLPELITRPVLAADAAAGLRTLLKEQQAQQAVSTARPSLRRKIRKIYDTAAVLAIAGLSCSALYFISLQTDYNLSSLNPLALFSQPDKGQSAAGSTATEDLLATEEIVVSAPEAPVNKLENTALPEPMETAPATTIAETAPEKAKPALTATVKPAPVKAAIAREEKKETVREEKKERARVSAKEAKTPAVSAGTIPAAANKTSALTINTATNRYYIIAGGYSSLKNAKWGLKQFTSQEGKVILPVNPGELHRVSVQDYASKAEALQHLPELKKKYGNNIWILNY
jgi:hypothetical protein